MAKHLKATVHLYETEDGPLPFGESVVFGPDDDVPTWAVSKIGDHAWADDEDEPVKPVRTRRPSDK